MMTLQPDALGLCKFYWHCRVRKMIVETKQMMFVSSFIHNFISPENVLAKKI